MRGGELVTDPHDSTVGAIRVPSVGAEAAGRDVAELLAHQRAKMLAEIRAAKEAQAKGHR